jgi:hypothetical protein
MVLCPEDRNRKLWQSDPKAFDAGQFPNMPNTADPQRRRWPYSSSYVPTAGAWDASSVGNRVSQGADHGTYAINGTPKIGNRKLADVMYTSGKVHLYDYNQRHFGDPQPFWGLGQCKQPLLFFDGSVVVRKSADSNKGWHPNQPAAAMTPNVNYVPQPHEPPAVGATSNLGWGLYRWTRGGLSGVDFGGSEIRTGQPVP